MTNTEEMFRYLDLSNLNSNSIFCFGHCLPYLDIWLFSCHLFNISLSRKVIFDFKVILVPHFGDCHYQKDIFWKTVQWEGRAGGSFPIKKISL